MEKAIIDAIGQCILYHRVKSEQIRISVSRLPDDMPNAKETMVNVAIAHEMMICAIENCIANWQAQSKGE